MKNLKKEMDKMQGLTPEFTIILTVIVFVAIVFTCLVWVIRQKWKKIRAARLERD